MHPFRVLSHESFAHSETQIKQRKQTLLMILIARPRDSPKQCHHCALLGCFLLFAILNSVNAGFVKTVQDSNDVWWFEHNGNKFISMGVNHVNNGGFDDGVGGQESKICQSQTNNSLCGDTLSFCGALGYAPYYNNTQALYENDSHIWANNTVSNLQSWGLNTISGWSSTLMEQTVSNHKLYYAHLLDMGTTWITHSDGLDFDVFSTDFYNHCESIAQTQVMKWCTEKPFLNSVKARYRYIYTGIATSKRWIFAGLAVGQWSDLAFAIVWEIFKLFYGLEWVQESSAVFAKRIQRQPHFIKYCVGDQRHNLGWFAFSNTECVRG